MNKKAQGTFIFGIAFIIVGAVVMFTSLIGCIIGTPGHWDINAIAACYFSLTFVIKILIGISLFAGGIAMLKE